MERHEVQFERIARWLDGEQVELTPQQREAAEDIRRDEAALRAELDVPVPSAMMDRARRRMMAELARPTHRAVWARRAGAALAVAAAILLAFVAIWQPPERTAPTRANGRVEVPLEVVIEKMAEPARNVDLDLLAQQVAELEADIAYSMKVPPSCMDLQTDALQQEIEEFWLEDSPSWPLEG